MHEVDENCMDAFERLIKEYAENEGVTEQLKSTDQMEWVRLMNNIRNRVNEIIFHDFVYV